MQTDEKIIDPTKTRKDALVFETDQPAAMIGYYLAEPLSKTWTEDFMDSDTGEVVSIERQEIILRRGELITPEQAQSISFYQQSGDITKPVKLTDQRRQAEEYNTASLKPYKVTASINSKRHKFILEAQTVELAMEVARDWIELNYKGDFTIVGATALSNVILLNSNIERFKADGDTEEVSGTGESDGETTRYYMADAEVTINYLDDEPSEHNFTFIVKTLDVDTAKAAATAWISAKVRKNHNEAADGKEIASVKTTLTAVKPFACAALINRAFCEAYKTNE